MPLSPEAALSEAEYLANLYQCNYALVSKPLGVEVKPLHALEPGERVLEIIHAGPRDIQGD